MCHGDLHVGNILINDKKKFVFVDFERCVPHTAFVDIEEKKLLCYLEKLYVFRYFFELSANTNIESHKEVHKLFIKYFTDQLKQLLIDPQWISLFDLLLGNFDAGETYCHLALQRKKLALDTIFKAEYFLHNSERYMFHKYFQQKRFEHV
jgi:hypothetical protein